MSGCTWDELAFELWLAMGGVVTGAETLVDCIVVSIGVACEVDSARLSLLCVVGGVLPALVTDALIFLFFFRLPPRFASNSSSVSALTTLLPRLRQLLPVFPCPRFSRISLPFLCSCSSAHRSVFLQGNSVNSNRAIVGIEQKVETRKSAYYY